MAGNKSSHILVVDDDAAIRKLLKTYFEREGFRVSTAMNAEEMRTTMRAATIDLVVLDVMMPREDGLTAIRSLRAGSDTPVVMVTGKGETVDRIVGLELGADDYIAKPFEPRELLARIRTVLRRSGRGADAAPKLPDTLQFAGWLLDLGAQQLTNPDGQQVHLTQAEFRLLMMLVRNPNRVLTRDQLLEAAAGRSFEPFDRSIDVHISNVRRKLDGDSTGPSLIRTVRGSGYMFCPPRVQAPSAVT